jgi:hypothetical protein
MRAPRILAAWALLVLAGCAPTPAPSAPAAPGTSAPAEAPAQATPTAVAPEATPPASQEPSATPALGSPIARDPAPPVTSAVTESDPAASPAAPSLSCRSDADCAVKDVGSCCGYRPACVNADTPTFPEEVKARCAAEGRMGICGFQPVSGCQCVAGQCAARPETIGPAPPKALQ